MATDSSASSNAVDRYVLDFRALASSATGQSPAWLGSIRRKAIDRFASIGFPTTRDENWRFTNFSKLAEKEFRIRNGDSGHAHGSIGEGDELGWQAANRIVFVDGEYDAVLSSVEALPDGVLVGDLASAVTRDERAVAGNLTQVAENIDNPFEALNAAFMREGGVIFVPDGTVVVEPIQFLFLTTSHSSDTVNHLRNIFVVGENAEATVVETYLGLGDGCSWTNSVTEVVLGDSARLNTHRFQLEGENAFHTATTKCRQQRDSSYALTTAEFGGTLSRHDIKIGLHGEGASSELAGILHLRGKQHVDNHTTIEHAEPHCTSRENFNGIFDGESHGVFTGRILVQPGAQQTDAQQSSRNLLLSEKARADAQPQLEIFADDVKCTHGTTVGPIDQDALFYLRSKGLTSDAARSMLTYGFAGEIVNSIGVGGLRGWTDALLRSRLEKGNGGNREVGGK